VALLELALLSIALFASTNVDDIFVLVAFFADTRFRARDIVLGQLLGIFTLTAGSFALSLAALAIPGKWVGYLGLLPVALGLRMAWRAFRRRDDEKKGDDAPEEPAAKTASILSVALVTLANGADNVAAYVPFFATRKPWESGIVAGVFGLMTGLWCFFAYRIVHHPKLGAPLRKYGGRILPFVLVALGVWIFVESR